jgi:NCAIR mutase (PurE)-related protein
MDKKTIQKKIRDLKENRITEQEFLKFISYLPYHEHENLKLDFHRHLRRGVPEAIYGESKTISQLTAIIRNFQELGEELLITRISEAVYRKLSEECENIRYHPAARLVTHDHEPTAKYKHPVLVLSAGAADEKIAEETAVCSRYLGNPTDTNYDLGISCIFRILDLRKDLNRYSVICVVAGMEGALASVVSGLTATPVIAIPTSVGYGANLRGIAALLSMLNSCSGGLSVVNVDNGFGAAYLATLINRKIDNPSQ